VIENDDVKNVDAIHVCREHETSPDGQEHRASMDCWCEPICYTHIEHPKAGNHPIGIVCHKGVRAVVGMKARPVTPGEGDAA
jgi:hypothetical protein